MNRRLDEQPKPVDTQPHLSTARCTVVAGVTGGISTAFCDAITNRLPGTRLIRTAYSPQALELLSDSNVDIKLGIDADQNFGKAVVRIPATMPID